MDKSMVFMKCVSCQTFPRNRRIPLEQDFIFKEKGIQYFSCHRSAEKLVQNAFLSFEGFPCLRVGFPFFIFLFFIGLGLGLEPLFSPMR